MIHMPTSLVAAITLMEALDANRDLLQAKLNDAVAEMDSLARRNVSLAKLVQDYAIDVDMYRAEFNDSQGWVETLRNDVDSLRCQLQEWEDGVRQINDALDRT